MCLTILFVDPCELQRRIQINYQDPLDTRHHSQRQDWTPSPRRWRRGGWGWGRTWWQGSPCHVTQHPGWPSADVDTSHLKFTLKINRCSLTAGQLGSANFEKALVDCFCEITWEWGMCVWREGWLEHVVLSRTGSSYFPLLSLKIYFQFQTIKIWVWGICMQTFGRARFVTLKIVNHRNRNVSWIWISSICYTNVWLRVQANEKDVKLRLDRV